MNRNEIIKRRIELKKQLVMLTRKEIKELEEQLKKKAATLATEKADVTSPAAFNL